MASRNAHDEGYLIQITLEHIKPMDLRQAVRRLKLTSAYGPDNIPAFLVKDCSTALEDPLLHIYNLSIQHCSYPSKWKVSRVTPVPKTGSSTDITNYRPIAVLSVFGKLFESILNNYISIQIDRLLDNSQHGFRPARSTLTNHVRFVDYVKTNMRAGCQVDAAYFDFTKAFDLVDNDVLLTKLASLGFGIHLVRFMADYLKDRSQYVKVGNCKSQDYYTRSGISQGSTLGPTLFLIMINDLPKVLSRVKCLMFADDLKLFTCVRGARDCEILQQDINAVVEWSMENKLSFNVSKCKTITFSRSRSPIIASYELAGILLERVFTIRDLGLTMDSKLNFREHIIGTSKIANKSLGFIIRTGSQFNNVHVVKLLYNAYVRSKLEYNALVWNPHEKLYTLMIERIQRKFARYLYKRIYGYYPFLYPSMFVSGMVGLDTLEVRRKFMHIMHYYLLLVNRVDNPSVRECIYFYVPDQYVRGIGRRQHRLLVCPPSWSLPQAASSPTGSAVDLINSFLQADPDADIFIDDVNKMANRILSYLNSA